VTVEAVALVDMRAPKSCLIKLEINEIPPTSQYLFTEAVIQCAKMIVKGLENLDTMRQIDNAHDFTTGMHRQLRHCSCVKQKNHDALGKIRHSFHGCK
jgi:hypothetical protein